MRDHNSHAQETWQMIEEVINADLDYISLSGSSWIVDQISRTKKKQLWVFHAKILGVHDPWFKNIDPPP